MVTESEIESRENSNHCSLKDRHLYLQLNYAAAKFRSISCSVNRTLKLEKDV